MDYPTFATTRLAGIDSKRQPITDELRSDDQEHSQFPLLVSGLAQPVARELHRLVWAQSRARRPVMRTASIPANRFLAAVIQVAARLNHLWALYTAARVKILPAAFKSWIRVSRPPIVCRPLANHGKARVVRIEKLSFCKERIKKAAAKGARGHLVRRPILDQTLAKQRYRFRSGVADCRTDMLPASRQPGFPLHPGSRKHCRVSRDYWIC
jgi:hypothetical protein